MSSLHWTVRGIASAMTLGLACCSTTADAPPDASSPSQDACTPDDGSAIESASDEADATSEPDATVQPDVIAEPEAQDSDVSDAPQTSQLLPPLGSAVQQKLTSIKQVLAVVAPTWTDSHATLALFDRTSGAWTLSAGPWPAQTGSKGLSWGRGWTRPPTGATRIKVEGDKTAPAGIFKLGTIMGYDPQPPAGLGVPYQQSTSQTICVDDPTSTHYNQVFNATPDIPVDWSSNEDMRRSDDLYSLLALVGHNGLLGDEAPVPGGGSCIFMHLWSGPNDPTIGCTSLDGANLKAMLLKLISFDQVVLVQLPKAEYQDAVTFWDMPAMP